MSQINSALLSSGPSIEYNGITQNQRLTLDVFDLYYKPNLNFTEKAFQCVKPFLPLSLSNKLEQLQKKVIIIIEFYCVALGICFNLWDKG